MLHNGLYEQIINKGLDTSLGKRCFSDMRKMVNATKRCQLVAFVFALIP